jgi:uncharacterized protein
MNRKRLSSLLLAMAFCAVGTSRAAGQYAVTFEGNVPLKMRDGVILHADVYRPKVDGQFPVLLQRTPYDKNNGFSFG